MNVINYFIYGEKEIEYLKKKDKKLGAAIDNIGMIKRAVNPDPFHSIITSVVGQQISNKAAVTVNARLYELVDAINPENIGRANIEDIQKCGMSLRKATYIKGIAEAALTNTVDFNNLHLFSDEQIIEKLTSLYGVGNWTAEMLLIFSLGRMDVLSFKDLAIVRGMMRLYGLEKITKVDFEKYRKRYSPYGSVASLYLWELSV